MRRSRPAFSARLVQTADPNRLYTGSLPSAAAKPASRWTRADIKQTSVYLPEAAYEALRQVAFDERCKIHDLLIESVELALKKRGYPALAEMKAKWQRKER
jgi:hypothetical protein